MILKGGEILTKYILPVIFTALIAAVAEFLSPAGEGNGLSNHIKLVAGLCITIALLSPIRDGFDLLQGVVNGEYIEELPEEILPSDGLSNDYNSVFSERLESLTRAELEEEIRRVLNSEFDISDDNARIITELSDANGTVTLKRITVVLSKNAVFKNPHKINERLSSYFNCECEVAIE